MAKSSSSSSSIYVLLLAAAMTVSSMAVLCMAQSCQTNGGSPTTADASTCVNYVRNLGSSQCCQQTSGSACTTMYTAGTAAVDICGQSGCTTCANAGNALNTILANCPASVNGVSRVAGSIGAYGFTFQIRHS